MFWLDDPSALLTNFSFPPSGNLEKRSNNLSQLAIISALIISIFNRKFSIKYIVLILTIIIILYYIKTPTMKENFEFLKKPTLNRLNANRLNHRPQLRPFAQEINYDYISPNAQLIGVNTDKVKNNPKLTQQDIYRLDPIYRNSNYSQLNEQGDDYSYESGYLVNKPNLDFEKVVGGGGSSVENYKPDDADLIYTNYIDPSTTVYYSPEPLNSSIGISEMPTYDQYYIGKNVDLTQLEKKLEQLPAEYNTFDPRSFGYGTSYRKYLDPVNQNPKWYYKDIDNVKRMNGVIGRSRIDHLVSPYAAPQGELAVRNMAHKDYHDKDIARRNDFRDKWMRKYHSQVGWQRKIAPLRKNY